MSAMSRVLDKQAFLCNPENHPAIHTNEPVQFHSPIAAAQARADLRPRTACEHIRCAGSELGKSYRYHLITGTGSKRNGRPVRGFPRVKWHFNESHVFRQVYLAWPNFWMARMIQVPTRKVPYFDQ
jgi:hypothetical protein